MGHHVFLSYSRRDIGAMQQVRDILRSEKFDVWTDEGIETGTRSWKRAIENAILNADCFVCLLSPDSNHSEWVRAEIEFAELHDKPIYLILVRGDERDSVPFGFASMQWVDVRTSGSLDQRISKFADTLKDKIQVRESESVQRLVGTESTSDEFTDLIRLGNLAHYNERHDEAIRYYTKALNLDQENVDLNLNRGTSYLENNKYELAVVDLRHATELDQKNHVGFRRLGVALNALGRTEEAIEAFSAAIELQPSAKSHYERGNCRFDNGDHPGAIEDYTETIGLDHDELYPSAYNNRGECRFVIGEYHAALEDFEAAKQVMADRAYADAGRSVTLFVLGQTSEAISIWQSLIRNDAELEKPEYVLQRFGWAEPMVAQARLLLSQLTGNTL